MNETITGVLSGDDISALLRESASNLGVNISVALESARCALKLASEQGDHQKAGEGALLAGKAEYLGDNKTIALGYFEQALEQAQMASDDKTASAAWNNIGLIHFERAEWKEAEDAYRHSLFIKEKNKDERGIAISCQNLGGLYLPDSQVPEALHHYMRAKKIFENTGDKGHLATVIYNCGHIYAEDENCEEALEYFMTALDLATAVGDSLSVINIYINIGNAKYDLGQYEEAEHFLQLGLQMSRERDYKDGVTGALVNLCELFFLKGEHEKTLLYGKAITELGYEQNKHDLASACLILGKVYLNKGELEESEKEFIKAMNIAHGLESKRQVKDILQQLIKLSERQGNYKQAYHYQREYQMLKDEMHDSRIDRKLAEVKFQNELEQQQKEAEIERLRNVELRQEKERSDMLLKNILPDEVAEELKATGRSRARFFENVTVLFTDFVGFTKVSERLSPQQLVDELDVCFKAFDEIIGQYDIEKIKTIGDAYMAAAGLPNANACHFEDAVNAAIKIRDFMADRQKLMGESTFRIRLGIHSGPVIAGIVGLKKFAYDIWGDTVNTAARMEQSGEAGKINISGVTYDLIKDKFKCTYRGEIEAKNKGKLRMYFID